MDIKRKTLPRDDENTRIAKHLLNMLRKAGYIADTVEDWVDDNTRSPVNGRLN